jgi:multiple sugar transport system ATP-binding protein
MAGLELKGIRKSFGPLEVIKGVDLTVEDGEFVVFVGPSGCGKSTLLRMIAGLEEISTGDAFIAGKRVNDVEPRDRGVAMVFQSYALYPHMNVADNIGFSLKLARAPRADRDAKIREAARLLHLEELLERKPGQLSGGQRQRVAIGRAIVRKPKVFLFDEPLSNLDAALRGDMRLELARLHRDLAATMIYVTHDQVEAMTMADKIVVLDHGIVQQVGTPLDLYRRPANRFVAGFIGSPRMNFLEVTVSSTGTGSVTVKSDDIPALTVPVAGATVKTGAALTLGVRPHHIDPAAAALGGQVLIVERLGNEAIAVLELASGAPFTVAVPGDGTMQVGATYAFGVDPHRSHLFDANGTRLTSP